MTNDYKLGDLKQSKFILSSGGWMVAISVDKAILFLKVTGTILPFLFLWQLREILGL